MSAANQPGFIPPHGHYRTLLSYQKTEVNAASSHPGVLTPAEDYKNEF